MKHLFNQYQNLNDPFMKLLGFNLNLDSEVDVETSPNVVEVSSSPLA